MKFMFCCFAVLAITISIHSEEIWTSTSVFTTVITVDSLGNIAKTKDSVIVSENDSLYNRVKFISADSAIQCVVYHSIEYFLDTFAYFKRNPYFILFTPNLQGFSDSIYLLVNNNRMIQKTFTVTIVLPNKVTTTKSEYPDRFYLDTMNLSNTRNMILKEVTTYYSLQNTNIQFQAYNFINHQGNNSTLNAVYDIRGRKLHLFQKNMNFKASFQPYVVFKNKKANIILSNQGH